MKRVTLQPKVIAITRTRFSEAGKRLALLWIVFLMMGLLFVVGCGEEKKATQSDATTAATTPIVEDYTRDGVTITQSANASSITVAQELTLTLHVSRQEDARMSFPDWQAGDKLGEWTIGDIEITPSAMRPDGMIEEGVTLWLRPFLEGAYTVPTLTIEITNPENMSETLHTEPLTIQVTSVLDPQEREKVALRDIPSVVALSRAETYRDVLLPSVIIAGVVGGLAALLYMVWKRRATSLTLQEKTIAQLEALLKENLLRQGQTQMFYQRLSDILRRYIEKRFGLHAPEQTTEEFLEGLRDKRTLAENHGKLLKAFLVHCDLVKFAKHAPRREEIKAAVTSCKRFVIETTPEDAKDGRTHHA